LTRVYKSASVTAGGYNVLVDWADRLPQAVIKNQPAGKTNTVCPLQRLQDCHIETGTGDEASVLESVMMVMKTDD